MSVNTVVLISVKEIDAREICERIEGSVIDDFSNDANFKDVDPNHYMVFDYSDFMDAVNNQELDDLTGHFISFVTTPR